MCITFYVIRHFTYINSLDPHTTIFGKIISLSHRGENGGVEGDPMLLNLSKAHPSQCTNNFLLSKSYGLNVCITQFPMLNQIPNAMVLKCGALCRWPGHEGGASSMELVRVHIKGTGVYSPLLTCKDRQASYMRKRSSSDTESAGIRDFASRTIRNKFMLSYLKVFCLV